MNKYDAGGIALGGAPRFGDCWADLQKVNCRQSGEVHSAKFFADRATLSIQGHTRVKLSHLKLEFK